jgi:predicted AlkP superfamily pyrophosphatase or phosphodiesterase
MICRILIAIVLLLTTEQNVTAQKNINKNIQTNSSIERPKLIVGLVIDQMRWDYLYRYYNRYGEGGFKRLLKKGYSFENTMIPYVPTYTAVGHSTVYTGGIPATTGIVGNNWYERGIGKNMYCTEDSTVQGVGNNDVAGRMSPRNMWATTITDELRLSNNFASKVIGISLKDRGAILPAGHSANAAYWYDDKTGKWITSSFYMPSLPTWVNNFNVKDEVVSYMKKDWNTLYPINTYTQSTADDMPYEDDLANTKSHTFPYSLSGITTGKYNSFKFTPHAATFTFAFAKEAIVNEKLGLNKTTDFLAISISSTDYMGHTFGVNAIETEDTYLRLDKDLNDFLNYLDLKLGNNNYLVFLTADHGAAHIPAFLNDHNLPAGTFSESILTKELNTIIEDSFGIKKAIASIQNYQVYFNKKNIAQENKSDAIKEFTINFLKAQPYITQLFETEKIAQASIAEPMKTNCINGFSPSRSGDVQFMVKPAFFDGGKKGTTHGLWNPYDAHIPLLFYGWKIKPGKTNRETYMTDIAPTLAAMLHIQMPNGCVGKVLEEITK